MQRKKEILSIASLSIFLLMANTAFGAASFSIGGKPVVDIINDLITVILSYLGQISLLILIFGGISYIVSGSNPQIQEKAKKTIMFALFGLALSLVSFSLLAIIHSLVVVP